jgi:hypothetical protein
MVLQMGDWAGDSEEAVFMKGVRWICLLQIMRPEVPSKD